MRLYKAKSVQRTRCSANKGIFSAIVCSHKQTGRRFYRLGLEFSGAGAEAFAKASPGQFIELDLCNAALPPAEAIPEDLADTARRKILLRRPFSFCDVSTENDKAVIEILYCVVGPASLRMTTLAIGDSISTIGPLGNGFWVPEGKKTALLVSGGMGVPPLLHMAKVVKTNYPDINTVIFAGAKTKEELPFESEDFIRNKIKPLIATDDGSFGYRGFVTDYLIKWLSESTSPCEDMIIYGCGPEAMLTQITKIAKGNKIDCQVSMERMMACGIGLCQSCVVECRVGDSGQTVYKMCCKDGPVFDAKEVVFSL